MKILSYCILSFLWTVFQHIEEVYTVKGDNKDAAVDSFISEYINEVRRTLRIGVDQHIINKRSHPNIDLNNLTGIEMLVGFQEFYSLPYRFPRDLILFYHCMPEQKQWYSAALVTNQEETKYVDNTELVIFKIQGEKWLETSRVRAPEGQSIAVQQIQDSVYLVVAQYLEDRALGSTVWRLLADSDTLQFVHMLDTHLATHAIMWTDTDTFAAVAISENPAGTQKRYSTLSPVYRWHGHSFDMIDTLPTSNPQALVQFNIRSSLFVAVANFQNDFGETMIDSEIFRYNPTSGRFNVYQKLPTEAAVDIKAFCFQSNQITESFLIYASAFHTDERGVKDYNSQSVVYKLSDEEYFVPFQALQVSKVTSWLPVQHVKDGLESLTLIGASDEGIISFQYDGWRFVPTGLYYDRSTFGPGPKSLNVFYFNDQTYISVANSHSTGYDTNVFSPVFKHHYGIEKMQKLISEWVKEMNQEMVEGEAKIIELTRICREAPSVDDSVVEIGSHTVFRNADIHVLETITTTVGDYDEDLLIYNKLSNLKNQLDILNKTLPNLPNRIDQTSFHSNTVYEDVIEDLVDIACTHSCDVHELEVIDVNGENLSEFLDNTININDAVELTGEISFQELALIEPLNTKKINGHVKETLIDWSKEVNIGHKLMVKGDVLAKNSIIVSDTVDGIFINVVNKEDIFESEAAISPTKNIESLNTSQLMLFDGKLSEVDFRKFVISTLKTNGDQIFSEFQDVRRMEADEVMAVNLYKAASPLSSLSQQSSCNDEDCEEDRAQPDGIMSRARSKKIESINLLDDIIIIPRNFTLYGTVIVENGFLEASDLIDLKHNVSAERLSRLSIPLNQSTINHHLKFNKEPQTPMLKVDTLNSMSLKSLVGANENEEGALRLKGKKTFIGTLAVDGSLRMNTVNGDCSHHLEKYQEDLEKVELEHLDVNKINITTILIGQNEWQNRAIMKEDGTAVFKTLNVGENVSANSFMVRGKINNFNLEKLLSDTAFYGGDSLLVISGTKHFNRGTEIIKLNINPNTSTNFYFTSTESVWKKRLSQAKSIEVDKLFYTGTLDGLGSSVFGRWLLTEGDQTVTAAQIIASLQAHSVELPSWATFNSLNISHLLTQALLTSHNATFDSIFFEEPVQTSSLHVRSRMNGLKVPGDIVTMDPTVDQMVAAHKTVARSLSLAGDLHSSGLVNGVNIPSYCQALLSNNSNLIISGAGKFKQEPEIATSVNGIEWQNITHNIWFKEDNVTFTKKILMNEVYFEKIEVENINNNNVEEQLSRLISLSRDQNINGTLYFSNVKAEKGLKADKAVVGGDVEGINLPLFIKNVLLNGVNQDIVGYLDFNSLLIENEFKTKGLVNGLNLTSEVMLGNVASNRVTTELTLGRLTARTLRLPTGTLVAGVDMEKWNRTAVTKSGGRHDIAGSLTVLGQLHSSQGIRVERSLNGNHFDEKNVMISSGIQEVTGQKIFSLESELVIDELKVQGFINDLNITNFYNRQVTTVGDVTIAGHTQLKAPLWSDRVVLPEMYQDHNLTWLNYQLSAPLPWTTFYNHMASIHQSHHLGSQCLAGSAYYLNNITIEGTVAGDVLATLPLKSGNETSLGVVTSNSTGLTLSLLTWTDENNMFMQLPGSLAYSLNQGQSKAQMVILPGGELASYVTGYLPGNKTSSVGTGYLFRLKDGFIKLTKIPGGAPGSSLLPFLDYQQRTCFLVVADHCRIHCIADGRLKTTRFFCYNITKAALLVTDRGLYLAGVQTRPHGSLLLWRMTARKFTLLLEMPQFNPISIAATTTIGPHVAVANLHRLGHSQPETVNIYRFDENTSQLLLVQSLPVVSPSQVMFSSLPTSECLLYVASFVPASPLQTYIYRGILGFQLHSLHSTLPVPFGLQPFTDHEQRYFLVLPSNHTATVLRGRFEGGPV